MLNQTKILRWRELEPIIGCWRMEREGTFPKRIQINSGSCPVDHLPVTRDCTALPAIEFMMLLRW